MALVPWKSGGGGVLSMFMLTFCVAQEIYFSCSRYFVQVSTFIMRVTKGEILVFEYMLPNSSMLLINYLMWGFRKLKF